MFLAANILINGYTFRVYIYYYNGNFIELVVYTIPGFTLWSNFVQRYCRLSGPSMHTLLLTLSFRIAKAWSYQIVCVCPSYGVLGWDCIWVSLTYFKGHKGPGSMVMIFHSQCQRDILKFQRQNLTTFHVCVFHTYREFGMFCISVTYFQGQYWVLGTTLTI